MIERRAKFVLGEAVKKYYSYLDKAETARQEKNGPQLHTMEDAVHTYRMLAENLYYILTGEVTDNIEVIKEYIGS